MEGPINKFTNSRQCDTHYKVTYLLLQRDLKNDNDVLKEAESRVEEEHQKIKAEKEVEIAHFNNTIQIHKKIENMKKLQKRADQQHFRDVWDVQIQEKDQML